MNNFVKLTHAEWTPGHLPGQTPLNGTYTAGTSVYIRPETVLAILPHKDFTWLVLSSDPQHRTGIEVMETSEEVYAVIQREADAEPEPHEWYADKAADALA